MDPRFVLPGTARLLLRRFGADDLPAMVAYRSDPAVARYQSWTPDWSMADAEEFLREDQATILGTSGTWTQVARREEPFGTWKASFPSRVARYVRLRAAKHTVLHLQGVAVR